MFFRLMFLQKAMMMEVKLEPVLFLSMYSIISCCRFQKLSFYKISWMIGPVTQIYLLSIFFIKSLLFNLTPSYKKMLIIYKIYEVFESKESSRMGIIAERYFFFNYIASSGGFVLIWEIALGISFTSFTISVLSSSVLLKGSVGFICSTALARQTQCIEVFFCLEQTKDMIALMDISLGGGLFNFCDNN